VEPFSSTVVNSEILYQCQTGLLQEGRGTLLCGKDGRWDPELQDLYTGMKFKKLLLILPYKSVLIDPYSCSRHKFVYSCYCRHYNYCLFTGGGALCGVLLTVCISRWNKNRCGSNKPAPNTQEQQQTVAVYETVDTQSKKIELKQNVAYGPVKQSQKIENVAYGPVKLNDIQ